MVPYFVQYLDFDLYFTDIKCFRRGDVQMLTTMNCQRFQANSV